MFSILVVIVGFLRAEPGCAQERAYFGTYDHYLEEMVGSGGLHFEPIAALLYR